MRPTKPISVRPHTAPPNPTVPAPTVEFYREVYAAARKAADFSAPFANRTFMVCCQARILDLQGHRPGDDVVISPREYAYAAKWVRDNDFRSAIHRSDIKN